MKNLLTVILVLILNSCINNSIYQNWDNIRITGKNRYPEFGNYKVYNLYIDYHRSNLKPTQDFTFGIDNESYSIKDVNIDFLNQHLIQKSSTYSDNEKIYYYTNFFVAEVKDNKIMNVNFRFFLDQTVFIQKNSNSKKYIYPFTISEIEQIFGKPDHKIETWEN